jgi:hypothetical protein
MPSDTVELSGDVHPLPDLYTLHERHGGFYKPLCVAYADAAALCLENDHSSPVNIKVETDENVCLRRLEWQSPGPNAKASWNNDDAVRDGA